MVDQPISTSVPGEDCSPVGCSVGGADSHVIVWSSIYHMIHMEVVLALLIGPLHTDYIDSFIKIQKWFQVAGSLMFGLNMSFARVTGTHTLLEP